MAVINLLLIMFFIFTLMYMFHIYILNYTQCVVYFIYAIKTHCFQTWKDGGSVSDVGGGVRQGPPSLVH
jgi:hypothetical protein